MIRHFSSWYYCSVFHKNWRLMRAAITDAVALKKIKGVGTKQGNIQLRLQIITAASVKMTPLGCCAV
jgi:hypothetical protein